VTYIVAMLALTVRALVILQYQSAHDIGLPLVALLGLVQPSSRRVERAPGDTEETY
jgi:hypothetical protein